LCSCDEFKIYYENIEKLEEFLHVMWILVFIKQTKQPFTF
jgi:hypothetical protein